MSRLVELQQFADVVAYNSWVRFQQVFPQLKTARPIVFISKRMKTTAGTCLPWDRKITLCFDLLDLYPSEYREDTIPHEVGHQVAYDLFGIGAGDSRQNWHGKEWVTTMAKAGFPFGRCHTMVNTRYNKRWNFRNGLLDSAARYWNPCRASVCTVQHGIRHWKKSTNEILSLCPSGSRRVAMRDRVCPVRHSRILVFFNRRNLWQRGNR